MTHSTYTLALNERWDLYLSGGGRLALNRGPRSTAQAVAGEVRRFLNDSYFDYDQGIPHFQVELGQRLSESALRSFIRRAALKVHDVAEILDIQLDDFDRESRTLSGSLSFKTVSGQDIHIAL